MSLPAFSGYSPIDPVALLAEFHAENVALQQELDITCQELDSERLILKRMMDIDNSLPISLLASILSIAHSKRDHSNALAASQQAHRDGVARLDLIQSREDWLTAAASSSDGPTFFGHSRRWQSLRSERIEAENKLRALVQHVTLMRERLVKLEIVEKQAWGALSINAIRPRSSRSDRPSSRQSDVTSRTIRVQASSTLVPTQSRPFIRTDLGETEDLSSPPYNTATLPEIPDSPTFAETQSTKQHTSDVPNAGVVSPESAPHPLVTPRPRATPVSRLSSRPNVTPLLIQKNPDRSSTTSSALPSPRSRSSVAELSLGPLTPLSSRMELPDLQIRVQDSHSDRDERARFQISHSIPDQRPSTSIKHPKGSRSSSDRVDARIEKGSNSTPFEFTPFSITPLNSFVDSNPQQLPAPSGSLLPRPLLASARSAPSLPSVKRGETSNSGGTLKKLGRGIFRSASSSGIMSTRSPTPTIPSAPVRDLPSSRVTQRLEPLVESWVMEQLEAPPPSPSPHELAAYYSENDGSGQRKIRRPFSGLLKPSVGAWLGGGSR